MCMSWEGSEWKLIKLIKYPANIYFLKVDNRNSRKRYEHVKSEQ